MYANWLTTTSIPATCSAPPIPQYYTGNSLVPQPDVLLEIGTPPLSSRYWAHSQVICQYSGYLRSAITSALSSSVKYDKPIFIPNISVDQFQPLLRYMYSGYLDLNMDNIFAVLLATHVLHMPHALEICRSFLSHMQAQGIMPSEDDTPATPTSSVKQLVLKPIPSKAKQVSHLQTTFSSPSAPHILVPSSDSTFQTLYTIPKECEAKVPLEHSVKQKRLSNSEKTDPKVDTVAHSEPCQPALGKAILDIASCDGPVRFRRVVNKYYNSTTTPTSDPYKSATLLHHHPQTDTSPSQRIQQLTSSSFHQQMARDINERRLCEDTQTSSVASQDTDQPKAECGSFKCAVCKHTFKSEYCYLKHSKRHLIPLVDSSEGHLPSDCDNAENSDQASPRTPGDIEKRRQKSSTHKSSSSCSQIREVIRPLDMNVQYYPCKTCGSKFPSYYFVHKHRKLCHQAQMDMDNEVMESAREMESGADTSPDNSRNPIAVSAGEVQEQRSE